MSLYLDKQNNIIVLLYIDVLFDLFLAPLI